MRGLIALTIIAGMLGAGGRTQAGPPTNGAGWHDESVHALAISDIEQRWSERVVVPLLERLRPVGHYEPVNLPTDEIVDLITNRPDSLGLMRRSSLPSEAVERLDGGKADGVARELGRHGVKTAAAQAAAASAARSQNSTRRKRRPSASSTADVAKEAAVKAAFASIVGALGEIDILVNNAGPARRARSAAGSNAAPA